LLPEGYRSAAYAQSLGFAGTPVELPQSGGWVIRRAIRDSCSHDAMGLYPYLCCSRWDALEFDLEALSQQVVLISAVADPLGNYDAGLLRRGFNRLRPFKAHYVIDTSAPVANHVKRSHRETARRAFRKVSVSVAIDPSIYGSEWVRLYDVLCHRHRIHGLRRFTPESLRQQLSVPGIVVFRAEAAGRTIGLDLWYVQDGCAHGHLAAFDEEGYRLRASYATKMFIVEHFHSRVAWINLGATVTEGDGLADFKSGWATGRRMSWLCGRIFKEVVYQGLMRRHGITDDGSFFPAYRRNEVF
jgi:hypothetical protein